MIDPPPPRAALELPWAARSEPATDPVAELAAARRQYGDTFVVEHEGVPYLFLFSPTGVRALYALPERVASKGLADYQMLIRKLPEELFQGRRTFAHDLFGAGEVEGYLSTLDGAIADQLAELGDEGTLEVFAYTRRLGHRLGLATWIGAEAARPPRLDALIADLDRLDGADAFVRPREMARVQAGGKRDERAALARVEGVVGEILIDRRGGDFLDTIAARWADVAAPERAQGIARDAILLHLASMSNLFAAMGWTLVHLLLHPEICARVRAGEDGLAARCALESIRVAQRSIVLRAVLRPLEIDDGRRVYRVSPGALLATMLPLTNTSAAPDLAGYDPERWAGRRLADESGLPAREMVTTFGHGLHSCPAQRFSLSAIVRTVERLLAAYDVKPRFSHARPYPDQIGGVARAAEPCPCSYRRRAR